MKSADAFCGAEITFTGGILMSKCIKCGAELEDGAKFCPECGEKQEQPAAESAQAQKTENTQTNDQAQNQNQNANIGAAPGANASDIGDKLKKLNDTADTTDEFDKADIESNKVMAVLAYLSWLVLIPLIGAQKSKYAKFHTNQGLILAITEIAWGIVSAVVKTIIRTVFSLIGLGFLATIINSLLGLVSLAFLVLSIIGIVNAVNGKAKQLPVIGKFTLIK